MEPFNESEAPLKWAADSCSWITDTVMKCQIQTINHRPWSWNPDNRVFNNSGCESLSQFRLLNYYMEMNVSFRELWIILAISIRIIEFSLLTHNFLFQVMPPRNILAFIVDMSLWMAGIWTDTLVMSTVKTVAHSLVTNARNNIRIKVAYNPICITCTISGLKMFARMCSNSDRYYY